MINEQLRLQHQLCFPIYVVSRLFIKAYQPHLDALGITYPQYLVLLVLWETDQITVSEIAEPLILNTNTVTPLLKRMETQGLLERQRSSEDERKVIVCLTEKGQQMQAAAAKIPELFISGLLSESITPADLIDLKDKLDRLIDHLGTGTDIEVP